ncbi:MAG: MBL fold metallo-hydrolase [Bacteroidota bacterium]
MGHSEIEIIYKTVGVWKENSYLLTFEGKSWIIDPGENFDELVAFFGNRTFVGIINTHGHFDHLGAVRQFQETHKIPFYIHSKDKRLVSQANLYRKMAGDATIYPTPAIDVYLDDLDPISIGSQIIRIHHIPGHTEGSVAFEIGNNLIVGDLLFENTVGRTDLPGGNKEKLFSSVNYVIRNFKNFVIYPGHGDAFILTDDAIRVFQEKLL